MTTDSFRIFVGRAADAESEREATVFSIEAGQIKSVEHLDRSKQLLEGDIDASDCLLVPGFIDIHVHGGAGRAIMEGSMAALNAVASHLARHGVTGFLSTTITAPWDQQIAALHTASVAMQYPAHISNGAAVLGCHLEGPYINPGKKGAQPGRFIRPPNIEEFCEQVGEDIGAVKIMTIAPEMEGALELIKFLSAQGIIASIGHTDATYDEVSAAIDAGATHVTHCFNAMRQLGSREPGVVGAALHRSEMKAELIWDNIHVHPVSCRSLIAAKGAEGVILISDGIPGAGMPEGYQFSLGDLPVNIQNGSARLPDGTLAGSLLTLDRAFANAAPYSLRERACMTSFNAARSLGLADKKGLLKPGYDADLTLLDKNGKVRQTFVAGRTIYSSTS